MDFLALKNELEAIVKSIQRAIDIINKSENKTFVICVTREHNVLNEPVVRAAYLRDWGRFGGISETCDIGLAIKYDTQNAASIEIEKMKKVFERNNNIQSFTILPTP
jgi:hypothetical protein